MAIEDSPVEERSEATAIMVRPGQWENEVKPALRANLIDFTTGVLEMRGRSEASAAGEPRSTSRRGAGNEETK